MTLPKKYSVHVAASGPPFDAEALEALADVFARYPRSAAAVSWGGLAGGPAARVSVSAASIAAAVLAATEQLKRALEEVGIRGVDIVEAEAQTEELLQRELEQPPEGYVGVSEIAEILGVSKQRVSELRARDDFPTPIAELAAGPVWTRSSLNHFIERWGRRPGRPRKVPGPARSA